MHYWFSGGNMLWMTLGWIVGLGFLIALVWLVIKGLAPTSTESPEMVLKRRFAAGEIDDKEYDDRLAKLRK